MNSAGKILEIENMRDMDYVITTRELAQIFPILNPLLFQFFQGLQYLNEGI